MGAKQKNIKNLLKSSNFMEEKEIITEIKNKDILISYEIDCLQDRIPPIKANLETLLHPEIRVEYTLKPKQTKKNNTTVFIEKKHTISFILIQITIITQKEILGPKKNIE
jgi:hypothetical protein